MYFYVDGYLEYVVSCFYATLASIVYYLEEVPDSTPITNFEEKQFVLLIRGHPVMSWSAIDIRVLIIELNYDKSNENISKMITNILLNATGEIVQVCKAKFIILTNCKGKVIKNLILIFMYAFRPYPFLCIDFYCDQADINLER